MWPSTSYRLVVVAAAVLSACTQEPTSPVAPAYGSPTVLASQGDGTVDMAGQRVSLRAQVSDGGIPSYQAAIEWRVTSGAGVFEVENLDQGGSAELVESLTDFTGTDGVARATFVPTVQGPSVVTASATAARGASAGSVDFFTTAAGVRIPIAKGVWDLSWPAGPQDVVVAVGTRVEWGVGSDYADSWWGYPARIRSTSEPPGGQTFDSETVEGGEVFHFVPKVPGEWVWEFEDGRITRSATLTAR